MSRTTKYTITTPLELQMTEKNIRLAFTCSECKTPVPLLDMLNVAWVPGTTGARVVCKPCTWKLDHAEGPYLDTWELEHLVREQVRVVDRRRAAR